jgi:ubiquinone/menaquinone biosynthesis C-methylase UbiE
VKLVAGSCGRMYLPLLNKLKRYPIPYLRLPRSNGGRFLDIGCAWGRWSLAAAGKGYRAVGIDPSLHNVFAARRIAKQLGYSENIYLVADGRYLPFVDGCFEAVFSYSCLQHMSKEDVCLILREIRRVLRRMGTSLVEMPNKWGILNLYNQMKRGFRVPVDTMVRYWRPKDLVSTFRECIGPTKLMVDGYFTINPQISDLDILPFRYKPIVLISEVLQKASRNLPPLKFLADSVYLVSLREEDKSPLYVRHDAEIEVAR